MGLLENNERAVEVENKARLSNHVKDIVAGKFSHSMERAAALRDALELVNVIGVASDAVKLASVVGGIYLEQDRAFGKDAMAASELPLSDEERSAILDYTQDGKQGVYRTINENLRNGTANNIDGRAKEVNDSLAGVFNRSGTTEKVRLFRGIPITIAARFDEELRSDAIRMLKTWLQNEKDQSKVAKIEAELKFLESDEIARAYFDDGYTSATTSLSAAATYAGEHGAILVLDLRKGYRAVALEPESAKPWEREVLLDKRAVLAIRDTAKIAIGDRIYRVYFARSGEK